MGSLELFFIAIGLSMDAFAVSICKGLTMKKATNKKALIVGLYFGLFQGLMPVIGYLCASLFADQISEYDHWIAFILLTFIGLKMIKDSFAKEEIDIVEEKLSPVKMLPLAIATSIDALAVGVSFAFLQVNIIFAAGLISLITFIISFLGVKIGGAFGCKLKSKSEFCGGVILILIGVKILLEHLNII